MILLTRPQTARHRDTELKSDQARCRRQELPPMLDKPDPSIAGHSSDRVRPALSAD